MIRNLLMGALALLWGSLIFVIGLHVNFPSEALMERARWEVQDRSDGAYALEALDARLWRLTGLEVDDAVIYKVPPRARRGKDGGPKAVPMMRVDSLAARVKLLPLITGKQELGFLAEVFGGDIGGSVSADGSTTVVDASGSDLDLSRMPIEGADWTVDAAGIAALIVDVSLDNDEIKKSKGTISLDIDGLQLLSAQAMGMTFDQQFDFSEAVLAFDIDGGEAKVSKGSFVSDALTATIEGDITLNKRGFSKWRLKLDIKLELGDELEQMAKFAGIGDAKDDDDVYHFSCSGSVGSPRCRADGVASGSRKTTRQGRNSRVRSNRKDLDDDAGLDINEDADPDERRAARKARRERRLERLRDRRERLREERDDDADPPQAIGAPAIGGGGMAGPGDRRQLFDREEILDDRDDRDDRDDFNEDFADDRVEDFDDFEPEFEEFEGNDDLPVDDEFFED